MPHLQNAIDFTVVAYLVFQNKVLLVQHKQLDLWLPVGGHIGLNEDPEQALFREIQEETGQAKNEIEIMGSKPENMSDRTAFLYAPAFLDIHRISDTHRHVGIVYFVRAKTDKVKLAEGEHQALRWFGKNELDVVAFALLPEVKFYAAQALQVIAHRADKA
jgi:8-oxo-dGTP pyrophosphatase MutT (NUDIX family)